MTLPPSLRRLLEDPPPEFAFEITSEGLAMSRTRPPATVLHASAADGFDQAIRRIVPQAPARVRRTCALLLPDNALRVSILDFDTLPAKEEDRRGLIRFRLRKTLPFDIDTAALSYHLVSPKRAVIAVAPAETIAHYEAPFRAAGLIPGFVTSTSLAILELIPAAGSLLVAHRSPGSLTVMAVQNGALSLIRTLELTTHNDPLAEVSEDLYPTLVYVEDQTGERPERLILTGFNDQEATRLSVELEIDTEVIADPHPGLSGYLRSLDVSATPERKAAA